MSAATEFDLGPLTWVKGEIDLALTRAAEVLVQYETTGDAGQLRFCRTHVHQAHGALAMVGLDGVTQVTESIEALLVALEEGRQQPTAEAAKALGGAIGAVGKYLDDLLAGEPNQALRLLPAYAALARARGLAACNPGDLFFPDLALRPPQRAVPLAPLSDEQMLTLLKSERARFQKGLLAWLKNAADRHGALEQMRSVLDNIEATQGAPGARAFWWAALAFVESLFDRGPDGDVEVRHLLGRIDSQIRRLAEGSHGIPERLMRDVLYEVALASPKSSLVVAEVQSVYELPALIPSQAAVQETTEPQEIALRSLRETLAATEELWNKFCSGSATALAAFEENARSCASAANELGQTDLKRLGQGFAALASWLAEDPKRHGDAVAMEVATAILLMQNAQDNFRRLGTDFAQQVDLMVARLHACIAGTPLSGGDELPLLDEMTRRAQEKLLVSQVAREIQNNLGQVEQALDGFFRNPEKLQDFAALDGPLKQTAGALAMLGHLGAVSTVQECNARIQRFGQPGYVPASGDFEEVARQLSMLGFFVDALQHGETDFDGFVRRLQGEQAGAAQPVTNGEQTAPEAAAPRPGPEMLDGFEAIENATTFGEHAAVAQVPSPDGALEETIVAPDAMFGFAAFAGEFDAAPPPASIEPPPPSVEAMALAHSAHEVIDAELLEIFLEEAQEVLVTIGEQFALLSRNPNDTEALTTIRRSAHTLKGSGRMVGLNDFGEAAWGLEQTLNFWLRQEMTATPELLGLIEKARDLFSTWVSALASGGSGIPDPAAMVATAARLRGEGLPEPVVEPVMPPAPEPELPVELVAVEAPDASAFVFDVSFPADVLPAEPAMTFDLSDAEAALPRSTGEVAEIPPLVEPLPIQTDTFVAAGEEASAPAMTLDFSETGAAPFQPAEEFAEAPPAVEPPPPAPTLYDVFREEARGYLDTLVAEYAVLENNPGAPTTFAMTRAAHTLGGIAATVGLMPLHHLAITLEHALLRRDVSGRPDSIEGLETVRQAIITLQMMFAGLARQEAPEEQIQLVAALEDVFLVQAEPEAASAPEPEALAEAPDVQPEPAGPMPEAAGVAPAVQRLQDELDEQLLPVFLEEAQDQLAGLTDQLRLWRDDLGSEAAPHAIARLLHTFKGNARMAGAMNLGEYTHLLESRVEELLRTGTATPALIDEIENACDTLAQATERLGRGEAAIPEAAPAAEAVGAPGEVQAVVLARDAEHDHEGEGGVQSASLRVRADLVDRLVNEAGELSIARARIEGEMRSLKGSLLDLTENVIRLRRQLREIEIQAEGQIQARVAQTHEGQGDFDPLELDRFTRFQELTRFMAESVNDVATVQQNLLKNLDDANAALIAQSRLNRGLQQALMGVRMTPFASQAERLFRIVRQSAKELGKRANLDILGGQVEVDRSVLDKMMAPIEHMLRNAVAHGIESRDERLAAGKREVGDITLKLTQEGNELILAMSDDGRGLDSARIRARAEALGLLEPGQPADDALLFDLIFRAGFSTAGEVSQLAGRGVGMDVVKTEVADLGGRIEIVSQLGQGTTFRLYLPLTLAVTQTLLLRAGNHNYAVPATMIEQVIELKEAGLADLRARGEMEWKGNRYPFHYLPHLLGDGDVQPEAQRQYWVLLLRSGSQRVAVQVDELLGNQEVVVKDIGTQLARVVGIAGATVLGDGRVVLILNPVALAARAPMVTVRSATTMAAEPVAVAPAARLPTVMVVDDSLTVRKITSRLLTREGYQVVLAKDGVDALEQLLEMRPDVILSDIEMPRMDGFDLVRNIRADKDLRDIPVVMITSRTAEKHRSYALEIGASHYLGKPYDEDELLALIGRYVKAKAA
jgi:chemosensory pili system protein ChpA (sensor histidine kinase/response regulator)